MSGELKDSLYAINLILVAVDEQSGSDYSGRIYTKYEEQPKCFHGIGELLNLMDEQYDQWCFPQSASINRAFTRKGLQKNAARCQAKRPLVEYVDNLPQYEQIYEERGKLGSFYVQTRFRQNASWQGDVLWFDKNRWSGFGSVLELILLMDDALENKGSAD